MQRKILSNPRFAEAAVGSAEMASGFPEFGPGLAQGVADKNVGMIDGLFVFNAKLVPTVCRELARNKFLLQIIEVLAKGNDRLRRWIAVAALPERIYAADDRRESVLRAVEIDGSSFAVVRN